MCLCDDVNINDRSGFRLHLGRTSHGCVTLAQNNSSWQQDWSSVDNLLKNTKKSTVIYEEPFYSRKPNWSITLYGELQVVNSRPWKDSQWDKPVGR